MTNSLSEAKKIAKTFSTETHNRRAIITDTRKLAVLEGKDESCYGYRYEICSWGSENVEKAKVAEYRNGELV